MLKNLALAFFALCCVLNPMVATADQKSDLAAAESYMSGLVSKLKPSIVCALQQHDPTGPSLSVLVYETFDPNYRFVAQYSAHPGGGADVEPTVILRRAASDISQGSNIVLHDQDTIALRFQGNYGGEETFLEDGGLKAKKNTSTGKYLLKEDLTILSARIHVPKAELVCIVVKNY